MKPSKKLAYWVGVAQSDGHYKIYNERRGAKLIERHIIQLGVGIKSLPMLKKFESISQKIFGTSGNYCMDKRKKYRFEIKIKRFLNEIKKLNISFSDPPTPPTWCLENRKYFGAYLAGVIDGDGDLRISRSRYPYCAIRITSGSKQINLREGIKTMLNCGCSHRKITRNSEIDGRKIKGTCHVIEFYVTPKNIEMVGQYIFPEISLIHKRDKLKEYKKLRTMCGDRTRELSDHNRVF
jgi:hypothetical protein